MKTLPLPGVPDVVWHDSALRCLFVAIGDPGVVCTFDSDQLRHIETVTTEEGAHTLAVDPFSHEVYVFCPESSGAAIYAAS